MMNNLQKDLQENVEKYNEKHHLHKRVKVINCYHCYPISTEVNIPDNFIRFWDWISIFHSAKSCTSLTLFYFKRVIKARAGRNRNAIISTDENPKLERTGIIKHEIKVTENPIKGRPYSVKDNKREKWMKEEIDRMFKNGIIKKSKSPWTSPVVLVSKKDGSIRFCVDYKKTNAIIIVDAHPLPVVNDTVDKIGGKKYYTSIEV